ncbi:MAG: hypothetical protein NC412_05230 [Roseburia sp.]|nr:hypothetical protein [Roseburia sp.]MCM1277583.1 hypothetical protein [Robinsoniella sp.]
MKKYLLTVLQGFFLFALSLLFSLNIELQAEAKSVDDTVNGVQYQDTMEMSVGYAADYAYGGGAYQSIYLSNDGDRIANIKSNSSNLLVKKTRESYNYTTETDWDTNQKTTKANYRYACLSFFAKKKGNYSVTFDVVKADGSVRCTKTIAVKAGAGSYESPIKNIKYAGKDLYSYYPYATKTSGKLKVTMQKAYKLLSIEVGSTDKTGQTVYKKVKNNKKISLAKKTVYSREYKYTNGGVKYAYDQLFPATYIRVTYQNKKTKEINTWTTTLHTINKKQSW